MTPVKSASLVFCEKFNWASGRDKDEGIRKIRGQLSEIRGQKIRRAEGQKMRKKRGRKKDEGRWTEDEKRTEVRSQRSASGP